VVAVAAPIPEDAPATTDPRRSRCATNRVLSMGFAVSLNAS